MAGGTLTTLDKVLKELYLPAIQDQINTKKVLLSKVERGPKRDVVGKSFVIPIMTGRHQGHGARAEDETLPAAGSVTWSNMTPSMKRNYARVRITGPAIEAAKSDKGSFVRALDSEIKGAEEGFLRSINRQVNGDGSGILALCGATGGSATVVVQDTKYLEVGQVVDVLVASSGSATSLITGETITAVDPVAKTITLSTSITTVAGTQAVYLTSSRNKEMMGILGLVNDQDPSAVLGATGGTGVGSLQGLAVASNTFWKSSRLHNSGTNRSISIRLLQSLFTEIDLASGRAFEIDMLYSRHGVWNAYGELLVPDRRFAGNAAEFDGSFQYLSFNGVKWFYDRDSPSNRVFAIDSKDIKLYEMSKIQWAARGNNASVLKWVADKDAWQAWLYWYSELAVARRFKHGVLEDITEV
jgi:hypothetical protein